MVTTRSFRTVKAVVAGVMLAPVPGAALAATAPATVPVAWSPRDEAASSHGVAVEYAPAERIGLDEATDAYVQGVAPPPPSPAPADPFDRMLTAAGRLPEPATWGLMILGFGGVAGAMRHRVRKSERDFNDRIRRITEGEE
jgi:hypothetical protein